MYITFLFTCTYIILFYYIITCTCTCTCSLLWPFHNVNIIITHFYTTCILYCTVIYYTVLYCIILYCTVLYYTTCILYCTVMYCTVLYRKTSLHEQILGRKTCHMKRSIHYLFKRGVVPYIQVRRKSWLVIYTCTCSMSFFIHWFTIIILKAYS